LREKRKIILEGAGAGLWGRSCEEKIKKNQRWVLSAENDRK
jgi:hypothetical protein